MKFDFKNNPNDIIGFLNSTAVSFYNGELEFLNRSYDSRYKANLLGGMIDIERTIRGTFGCDLSLETADYCLIKQMYPHACEMLNINGQDDLPRLSQLLNSLRDINAHAFSNDDNITFVRNDFSMLLNEKKMYGSLMYVKDGLITMAGITYLILNFLRSKSISTMVKDDFLVGVVSKGQYGDDKGEKLVSEISHVDLEIPIRKICGNDILSSIFGEYCNRLINNDDNFSFSIGKETYPTFKVAGSLNGDALKINANSLTRTYYKDDYSLKIVNVEDFINISNTLPMMSLVDFLYEYKIDIFDSEAVNKVNQEYKLLSKTNKPKFYADKKLSILLYKSDASDFRIISSLMADALSRIFISLENFIYKTRGIKRFKRDSSRDYSTIGKALKYVGVPDKIITEVKYLRNFCAHGYMLNDYLLFRDDVRQFTIEYIIATIKQLSDYLESHVRDAYNNFKEYKRSYFIDKVLRTKYKIAIQYSQIVIDEFPNYDRAELAKKNGFISNSFFDVTVFNEITSFEIQKIRVIELFVENINQYLYFYEGEQGRSRIDYFCSCFGYEITDEKDYGLIIEMAAIKTR